MRPGPHPDGELGAGTIQVILLAEMRGLQRQVAALHDELRRAHVPGTDARPDSGRPPPRATTAALYATCLGPFRVFRDGHELSLGGGRLVVDLFRLLVGAGRPVPRDEVLELLWPNADPLRSGHRLHVTVSALRQSLDLAGRGVSALKFQDDAYQVDPDTLSTDFQRFDAHYDDGRRWAEAGSADRAAESFKTALALYGGDFLADRPYADWALQRRAHFLERRLSASAMLAEYALGCNDLVAAVEYAHLQLAADSLRERAHRQLMRAHYLMGQRACAIRQYEHCAELLQREVGVTPSHLTRQLREAIVRDAVLPAESDARQGRTL